MAMYTAEDEEALLQGEPDFVVDAIDDINTKASSQTSAVEPINPGINAEFVGRYVADVYDRIQTGLLSIAVLFQVALLSACKSRGLPVLCACGAGTPPAFLLLCSKGGATGKKFCR